MVSADGPTVKQSARRSPVSNPVREQVCQVAWRGPSVNRLLRFFKPPELPTDPVCRMKVPVERPGGGAYEHQGTTYYFCGPGCRKAFSDDPEAYLSGEKRVDM